MRFWDRAVDPDTLSPRARSVIKPFPGTGATQFGQRPMFSVPGEDQPPPEDGRMGSEVQLDSVVPTDQSPGSAARTDLAKFRLDTSIILPVSTANVVNPPTEASITTAFPGKPAGFVGLIDDAGFGTALWLVISLGSNNWFHIALVNSV